MGRTSMPCAASAAQASAAGRWIAFRAAEALAGLRLTLVDVLPPRDLGDRRRALVGIRRTQPVGERHPEGRARWHP
jgi:hypothetical protein